MTMRGNLITAAFAFIASGAVAADPLPSWFDGKAKPSVVA
jgi:hypothetical protein